MFETAEEYFEALENGVFENGRYFPNDPELYYGADADHYFSPETGERLSGNETDLNLYFS